MKSISIPEKLAQWATRLGSQTALAKELGISGAYLSDVIHGADPVEVAGKLCNRREKFYRNLAEKKPAMKVFLRGWLRRNNALKSEVLKVS